MSVFAGLSIFKMVFRFSLFLKRWLASARRKSWSACWTICSPNLTSWPERTTVCVLNCSATATTASPASLKLAPTTPTAVSKWVCTWSPPSHPSAKRLRCLATILKNCNYSRVSSDCKNVSKIKRNLSSSISEYTDYRNEFNLFLKIMWKLSFQE